MFSFISFHAKKYRVTGVNGDGSGEGPRERLGQHPQPGDHLFMQLDPRWSWNSRLTDPPTFSAAWRCQAALGQRLRGPPPSLLSLLPCAPLGLWELLN